MGFRQVILGFLAPLLLLFSVGVQKHLHTHGSQGRHAHWFVGGISEVAHHHFQHACKQGADSTQARALCCGHELNEFKLNEPAREASSAPIVRAPAAAAKLPWPADVLRLTPQYNRLHHTAQALTQSAEPAPYLVLQVLRL